VAPSHVRALEGLDSFDMDLPRLHQLVKPTHPPLRMLCLYIPPPQGHEVSQKNVFSKTPKTVGTPFGGKKLCANNPKKMWGQPEFPPAVNAKKNWGPPFKNLSGDFPPI